MDASSQNAWWTIPENFEHPSVLWLTAEEEQHIFGPDDIYLQHIEVHSNTFIQLERWFTPSGHTQITIVGPLREKQWLLDMIWRVFSQEAYQQARGQEMLDRVRNQPLTTADLDASLRVQTYLPGAQLLLSRQKPPPGTDLPWEPRI